MSGTPAGVDFLNSDSCRCDRSSALTFDKTLQDNLLVLLRVRLADDREQVASGERTRRGRRGGHICPEGQRPLVVVLHRRRRRRRDCRRIGQSALVADRSARLLREEYSPAAGAPRLRALRIDRRAAQRPARRRRASDRPALSASLRPDSHPPR